MAYQLIYTSIRSGLTAGRSGFCTAARHKEIKESLVARLEDLASAYDRGILGREGALPILYSYRIIDIRESRYHVLMRIGDAGNDYSGRTNHLAHFLVIEPGELTGLSITPAEAILALQARGFWKSRYEDSATYLGVEDIVSLSSLSPSVALPAAAWTEWSGDPGNAAYLYDSDGPQKIGFPTEGDSEDAAGQLLRLFAEGALLSNPERIDSTTLWSVPFTTLLQSGADRRAFAWAGVPAGTSLADKEEATGRRLFAKGVAVTPPTGDLAAIAAGREVEPVYSPLPLTPTQGASAQVESTPPAQAGAVSGPEQVNLPSADLSGSVPGASIPISLNPRETEKRRQGNGLVKVALIAVAVLCMLGLIGATVYQFVPNERRDLEREIEVLINHSEWSQIHEKLGSTADDLISASEYLQESRIRARLEWLSEKPEDFAEIEDGTNSPSQALEKVIQESGELIAKSEKLKKAREKSEKKSEEWDDLEAEIEALRKDLIAQFDGDSQVTNRTAKDIEELQAQTYLIYGDSSKAENDLGQEFKALLESVSQFEKLEELKKTYRSKEEFEKASKQKKEAMNSLKSKMAQSPRVIKRLYFRYEKLTFELEEVKEPMVVESDEAKKEPTESKSNLPPVDDWPVYLIPIESGKIDLSPVAEVSDALPDAIVIKQPDGTRVKLDYFKKMAEYQKGKIISISSNGSELEIKKSNGIQFKSGTILQPEGDSPDFQVMLLDGDSTENSSPLLDDLGVRDCLTQNNGAFQIAEQAKAQLERFKVKHTKGKWRMTVNFDNYTDSAEGEIAGLSLDHITKTKAALEAARNKKSRAAQSAEITSEFNKTFVPIGELLFPEFTGTHPRFEIIEGGGNHQIKLLTNPKRITEAWQQFDRKEPYHEFVETLFGKLKNLAGNCGAHKQHNGEIDGMKRKVQENLDRKNLIEAVSEWERLAETSRNGKWSDMPVTPSSFKTNSEAEKALEEYEAHFHFSRFFRAWEGIFLDKVKVKSLNAYLKNPAAFRGRGVEPLNKIEAEINNLEARLGQLESDDILKNLQVSFFYTWKEDLTEKSFLVLKSKPDDAN